MRRRRRLEFDVQISWQAGGLRRTLQVQRIMTFDMWLVFRNRGMSRAKAAKSLEVVFGSALAAKCIGRAARCES